MIYEVPLDAVSAGGGKGIMGVTPPTFVMKLQTAHLTDGAPYGYINTVWHWPQFT